MGSNNSSSTKIHHGYQYPTYIGREVNSENIVHQNRQPTIVHHKPQVKAIDEDLKAKSVHDKSQIKAVDENLKAKSVHHKSKVKAVGEDLRAKPVDHQSEAKHGQLDLNKVTFPSSISHAKSGNTLCSNDKVMLIQDGSTTIEFLFLPNLDSKRLPWRFGLVRDIVWCSALDLFILLTKDGLFSISPKSLFVSATALYRPIPDFTINTYKKVVPYDEKSSFWRCTCVGTSLYISYSGHGAVIDEYSLKVSTCKFVNRWIPPKTCAEYEDIWCIRYHPDTGEFGFAILDTRNDHWRIEGRSRDKLARLWALALPFEDGDCEISPLSNGEWLAINACGSGFVQIANRTIKAEADYDRELRNAIVINNEHFAVRTKTTIEMQPIKGKK